jgi:hypothetical protein
MTSAYRILDYSAADIAALRVLTAWQLETHKALQDLARIVATECGIVSQSCVQLAIYSLQLACETRR